MHTHTPLADVLILLTLSMLLVGLARRYRLPSLLAYLVIGVLVGPHGLGLVAEDDATSGVAEFGVVFLMFSIGLEFSLTRLKTMRNLVFGLGGGQVGLTLLGTWLATVFFYGNDWRIGLAMGGAIAMSSTAIVSKLLSERLELHSQAGRQSMAVLLFQDLAVVPLLILVPALAQPAEQLAVSLLWASVQAAVVLFLLVGIGQRLVQRGFALMVRQRSREVFMLTVLWLVVALSTATAAAGLSLALGAFVGGMLVSETLYRHQVEADIRPFRDVLLGLFFVTLGMLLDIGFVLTHITSVLLALLLLLGGKTAVVLGLAALFRNRPETAMRTALQLAQAVEFGFVLLQQALDTGLIPDAIFQVTMAAMLLSMFLAPLLIHHAGRVGRHFARRLGPVAAGRPNPAPTATAPVGEDLRDHVIVCGFGRSGQNLARLLEQEKVPFIALDIDPERIRQAQAAGERVLYGDADRREVLQAAGLERARAVAITYADPISAEKVIHTVRNFSPTLPVVVRTADDGPLDRLRSLGATEVIPDVLEGSLMLAVQTLTVAGIPVEQAQARVRQARSERYSLLRAFYRGESDRLHRPTLEKLAYVVESHTPCVGRRLGELELGAEVRIDSLVRHGERLTAITPERRLLAGDVLVLSGPAEPLRLAERTLLLGGRRSVPMTTHTS